MTWWMTYSWVIKPVAVVVVCFLIGVLINRLIQRRIRQWSKSPNAIMMADVLSGVPIVMGVFVGISGAIELTILPPMVTKLAGQSIIVLGIGFGTWVLDRLVSVGLTNMMVSQRAMPSSSIMVNIAKIVVYSLGVMVALNSIGVSVAPIITALGIGGLAVALALKDTLSNLFSGIQLILSNQLRTGDYVKVGGDDGIIVDITWRNTSIQSLSGNLVIVPNAVLATATFTNYSLPLKEYACSIPIELPVQPDLQRLEGIITDEIATLATMYPHLITKRPPLVRLQSFTSTGISLTVVMTVVHYGVQSESRHLLIKSLLARFEAEQVYIPLPVREIHHIHTPPDDDLLG